jgi:hypothetical protein
MQPEKTLSGRPLHPPHHHMAHSLAPSTTIRIKVERFKNMTDHDIIYLPLTAREYRYLHHLLF